MRGLSLFIGILLFFNCQKSAAQYKFFASSGILYLQEKQNTFYRMSIADPRFYEAGKLSGKFAPFIDVGLKYRQKNLSWLVALGISRNKYNFKPELRVWTQPEESSIRYFSYTLKVIPIWRLFDDKINLGLGFEAQYISKPKITHSGIGQHNIYEEKVFSKAFVFNASWNFKKFDRSFILAYNYSIYLDSFSSLNLRLFYGPDNKDRFHHFFLFNTHLLKLSYVFN